ncbi:hypothetical protein BHM03_00015215 [Ensete ventricosum]|nr:hypothetical protein BHM03_00015215 [Ensete ventricosum]
MAGIRIQTPYKGSAVRFSRFDAFRLLVSTRDRYASSLGLHVLQVFPTPSGGNIINEVATFDSDEGVNDCCWSESHHSHAVSGLTDGTVKLWDTSLPPASQPVSIFREHRDEVRSVDWNPSVNNFLSASNDAEIKLWIPGRDNSYHTFEGHTEKVNAVAWNPSQPHVFVSASYDRTVGLWDVRDNRSITRIFDNHPFGVVSCNWNKQHEFLIATASGRSINVWDIRRTRVPMFDFISHDRNVCRVCFSPHKCQTLLSCSLDHTVRTWDIQEQVLTARYELHHSAVYGIDMSVHIEDLIASTGRDQLVHIWRAST